MTSLQWNAFCIFRDFFRRKVQEWSVHSKELIPLQIQAAYGNTPPYPLETAIVYNRALDNITEENDIRLIIIGDNPGKDEQLACNNEYLVGQSGKIAEGFFRRTPELNTDFRKNVIILNKTPIHTAKTAHLKKLQKADIQSALLIRETQVWMAEQTAHLHQSLLQYNAKNEPLPQLWLVGYAELKNNGIFVPYRDELSASYKSGSSAWEYVFAFHHFSMNRFLIDLHSWQEAHPEKGIKQSLIGLGCTHRRELFGK
jgi:hypothetical protein